MTAPVASLEAQISDLLSNFGSDSGLLNENNAYYEATYRPKAIGMAVPPPMKKLMAKIGWARTYVNAIEERLDIEGFRMVKKNGAGKADERLWQWWQANNMDVESGLAHTAPVTDDPLSDSNTPVIKVESPRDIYAEVDPVTRRVKRAIRRYWGKNPVGAKIMRVTLYLPNSTIGLVEGRSGWEQEWRVDHNLGIVPVIPILNKERVRQEKGVTEIKPELRSKIDAASRLLMNLQATAELMAVPQRVLFGLDENEIAKIEGKSAWEAYLANILAPVSVGCVERIWTGAEEVRFLPSRPGCDKCGVEARSVVILDVPEPPNVLLFCGHHTNQFEPALIAAGATIYRKEDK